MLEVSPRRIEGRLPTGAPLGDVSLTVMVEGAASAPYSMKVVPSGFGIFSRNLEGWGPGRLDNLTSGGSRSENSLRSAAQPGQSVVLSGTGVGASRPEVWVGLQRATVDAVRHGATDGADEIVFRLPPESPAGCYVPLQVRQAGAAPSNTFTVSIHAGGGLASLHPYCRPRPGPAVARGWW